MVCIFLFGCESFSFGISLSTEKLNEISNAIEPVKDSRIPTDRAVPIIAVAVVNSAYSWFLTKANAMHKFNCAAYANKIHQQLAMFINSIDACLFEEAKKN